MGLDGWATNPRAARSNPLLTKEYLAHEMCNTSLGTFSTKKAQTLSRAKCGSSRIPASLCNLLGTTLVSASKTAARVCHSGTKVLKSDTSSLAGTGQRQKNQRHAGRDRPGRVGRERRAGRGRGKREQTIERRKGERKPV